MASVSPTKVWAEEKGTKVVHSTVAESTTVEVNHSPLGCSLLRVSGETAGQYNLKVSTQNNPTTYQAPSRPPDNTRHLVYVISFHLHNNKANRTLLPLAFTDEETKTQRG